ncbi:MAG: hypothetical protein WBQ26_00615 [Gemmatimonadaceae bacterium]|nr:hypothetical protein [Gemmatimonadaceae bacterium]
MNLRRLIVPLALAVATAGWAVQQQQSRGTFPHSRHAKLFPTCEGCHSGILDGDTARMFPTKDACAQCHNGTDQRLVAWSGPSWHATNLKFSHTDHAATSAQAGNPAACANCHGQQAGRDTAWMHVAGANPDACIACHTHQAPAHLASTATCTTCHEPLTQATALTASAIANFPKPPSHDAPDFLAAHAPTTGAQVAQCATCHARESCARCHANADQLPAIRSLANDVRVASLVRNVAPVYFTPASHRTAGWPYEHGKDAGANPQTCGSCHTQTSCRTCHIGALGSSVIAKLPEAKPGQAPGVVLVAPPRTPPRQSVTVTAAANAPATTLLATARDTVRLAVVHVHPAGFATNHETAATTGQLDCQGCHKPSDCAACHDGVPTRQSSHVHPAGFATNHKTAAASGLLNCQGCHKPSDCTACHDGVSPRQDFHPADFMARHATAAYSQEQNCSSCHRVETFCRSCHQKSGIANSGGVRGTAHTGQPLWLLQHGQAARQGLTGCTSCHQQSDCLRCHSSLGMHVNPHGPNFNAESMGSKNMQMCLVCHLTNPLKGGG